MQLDWNDPVRTLKIDVDQDKARALGLAPAEVAIATQTLMNGATALAPARRRRAGRHRGARGAGGADQPGHPEGREPPYPPGHGRAAVAGREGSVRAGRAGAVAPQPRHGHHRARGRRRTASRPCRSRRRSSRCCKAIEAKLPSGYRIDTGGAVEESDKANSALLAVVPLMVVAILLLLMLQLQSFSPHVDGVPHGAARHDRRGARAARVPGAVRLRRACWASSRWAE